MKLCQIVCLYYKNLLSYTKTYFCAKYKKLLGIEWKKKAHHLSYPNVEQGTKNKTQTTTRNLKEKTFITVHKKTNAIF